MCQIFRKFLDISQINGRALDKLDGLCWKLFVDRFSVCAHNICRVFCPAEFKRQSQQCAVCAHYFSYYDIPRDTNLEIEKLPAAGITLTRFVASDAARGRKNELLYSELSGLHRPRIRTSALFPLHKIEFIEISTLTGYRST